MAPRPTGITRGEAKVLQTIKELGIVCKGKPGILQLRCNTQKYRRVRILTHPGFPDFPKVHNSLNSYARSACSAKLVQWRNVVEVCQGAPEGVLLQQFLESHSEYTCRSQSTSKNGTPSTSQDNQSQSCNSGESLQASANRAQERTPHQVYEYQWKELWQQGIERQETIRQLTEEKEQLQQKLTKEREDRMAETAIWGDRCSQLKSEKEQLSEENERLKIKVEILEKDGDEATVMASKVLSMCTDDLKRESQELLSQALLSRLAW